LRAAVGADLAAKCTQNWDAVCTAKYQIKERLNTLLGAPVAASLVAGDGAVTGNLLMASGCQPHVCPWAGDAFVFDLNTSTLVVAIHESDTITVYGSELNSVESIPKPLLAWIQDRQSGMTPPPKIGFAASYKPRELELVAGQEYKVPPQRQWKIDGLLPQKMEGPVDADLYMDGEVFVGDSYEVHGKFDLNIEQKQKESLIVRAGSTVRVGDSRETVKVKETARQ